ncbi:MAG: flagellin [Desulfosporosinus sp.]|nr:flagellin [Desulfosporosinus sp.]
MIINTNIAANNTIRQLGINQASTQSSLEKLSSGLRINSAADDPAGLTISEQMRGQISGLNQANSNAQNGVSLVSTAEGALNETTSVLQSMRALAVQAANGTNTTTDAAALQTESDALASTIDDIGNQTQFNTKNLLNGNVAVQTTSSNAGISATGTSATTANGTYAVTITAKATQAKISGTAFGAVTAANAGTLTINGSNISISSGDTIGDVAAKINNVSSATGVTAIIQGVSGSQHLDLQTNAYGSSATINVSASTAALGNTALGLTAAGATTAVAVGSDVKGTIDGTAADGKGLQLTQVTDPNTANGAAGLTVNTAVTDTASTATIAHATVSGNLGSAMASGSKLTINGKTITFKSTSGAAGSNVFAIPATVSGLASDINSITKETGVTASMDNNGNLTLTTVAQGVNATMKISASGAGASGISAALNATKIVGSDNLAKVSGTTTDVTVNTGNTLKLQIGANQGQTMSISINDMRAKALGVDKLDLTTVSGAAAAITAIDAATSMVTAQRSQLGAAQNRLQDTMANLGTSSQNVTTAEANIRDVDMASEMTNFQKNNVLSQAATSMLAQANQLSQGVLKLLQ